MSYQDLIERKYQVVSYAEFGDYEGDFLFLVYDQDGADMQRRLGVVVTSYGSCSGCDAYEGACEDGTLDELTAELHNAIVWGTEHELKLYLLGTDGPLHHWFHEQDFEQAAHTVFAQHLVLDQ